MVQVPYGDFHYGDRITIDCGYNFLYGLKTGKATFLWAKKPDGRKKEVVLVVRPYKCSDLQYIDVDQIKSIKKGWD